MAKAASSNGALSAFENISLPGIKSLTDRRQPRWAKVIWSLIFLICTILCIYQVVERMENFFEFPVNLMYELKHLEDRRIPMVTICLDDNTRMRKRLTEAGAKPTFDERSANHALIWEAANSSLPDIVSSCSYSGMQNCLIEQYWHQQMTASGRCYTLDVGINLHSAGVSTGFKLKLTLPLSVDTSEYLKWKVLLHDKMEDALYGSLITAIPIYISTVTTIIYAYKQFILLNVTNRHCYKKEDVMACWLKCSDQIFFQKYNCSFKFTKTLVGQPQCDDAVDMTDAEYLAYTYDVSSCQCGSPCVEESYDMQVDTRRTESERSSSLKIYQGREELEVFEEKRAYVLYALICEIGGILGLYLGACVLTFIEILDLLFHICYPNLIRSRNAVRPIKPKTLRPLRITISYY